MDLKIDFPKLALIGQPLDVNVEIDIESVSRIAYSGVKLSAIRPCERPLLIEQREIFCNGIFDKGIYKRKTTIPISKKVVPSSEKRGIKYIMELYTRVPAGKDDASSHELVSSKKDGIMLVEEPDPKKPLQVNPVVLAIKGLKISLQKDTFKPGETIKINFEARELRNLKVLLMQRSNIICDCTQYGRVCTKVPTIPASAAGAAKADNPTTGFLLLSVPREAELSTRHVWEPKEKSTWNDKFGDYNEWFLAISGKKYNGELVNFDIPIEIDKGIISKEERESIQFFESSDGDALAGSQQLFKQRRITLQRVDKQDAGLMIEVQNECKDDFNGCTCRITGIRDMFFETAPFMVGFSDLESNATRTLEVPDIVPNVSEIKLDFESNNYHLGTFREAL
ncbi:hypothetical protein GF325_17425 [Candidatus Bathyarchaeota archaeon]|nr:hypothetical protein [Candidatus Bathyarchaeota archaeon]